MIQICFQQDSVSVTTFWIITLILIISIGFIIDNVYKFKHDTEKELQKVQKKFSELNKDIDDIHKELDEINK